jgi:phage baseplate assembly protein V
MSEDLEESGFYEAEMDRRLSNLLRQGTVVELDVEAARVKVQVDELTTDWLPWMATRSGKSRDWSTPEIGEQVLLLSPSGELAQGWVQRGVYQDSLPAPPGATATQHITLFDDGTKTVYDLLTKTMSVYCVGSINAQALGDITVEAVGSINLTAGAEINLAAATINIIAGVEIGIAAPTIGIASGSGIAGGTTFEGDTDWTGNITHHDGNLSSNGIIVHTHHHSGVQPGAGTTGPPV